MKTVCNYDECTGCMACIDKCPKQCISIEDNLYALNAIKDIELCIECGLCEKVCPNKNLIQKHNPIEWKQGWAEWSVRCNSSSGGAASAIIGSFIKNGGYVASCLFKEGQFLFDITNDLEYAKQFAGSKYVKSNPVGIYKKIQERLKTDKVLFIGLPCQVAGLKNYIVDQKYLYTIDLICHGTPSIDILKLYLNEKKIDLNEVSTISFRKNIIMGLDIDGKRMCSVGEDDYLMSYLDSLTYTENCYQCKYASFDRVSDITLGDSWDSEYKNEEKNGISLILIQTEKGKKICSNLELFDVDINIAKSVNHQLNNPSLKNSNREFFINGLKEGNKFSALIRKLYKNKIIKRYIKYILVFLKFREPIEVE